MRNNLQIQEKIIKKHDGLIKKLCKRISLFQFQFESANF